MIWGQAKTRGLKKSHSADTWQRPFPLLKRWRAVSVQGKPVFSTAYTLYRLTMAVSGHAFMFTHLMVSQLWPFRPHCSRIKSLNRDLIQEPVWLCLNTRKSWELWGLQSRAYSFSMEMLNILDSALLTECLRFIWRPRKFPKKRETLALGLPYPLSKLYSLPLEFF